MYFSGKRKKNPERLNRAECRLPQHPWLDARATTTTTTTTVAIVVEAENKKKSAHSAHVSLRPYGTSYALICREIITRSNRTRERERERHIPGATRFIRMLRPRSVLFISFHSWGRPYEHPTLMHIIHTRTLAHPIAPAPRMIHALSMVS